MENQAGELTVQNVFVGEDVGLLVPGIIKITVNERDANSQPIGKTIAGVKLRAVDNLGNVYYAESNSNGVAYFSGLNVTRSYTITTMDAPFIYGTGPWPAASLKDLVFGDITTPFYREGIFWLDKTLTDRLEVRVYEKGDSRINIPGAQIELTYPNGEKVVKTTDSDGYVIFEDLPKGFDYEIKQLTTQNKYLKSDEVYTLHIMRFANIDIPNKLQHPELEVRDIVVNKIWQDPKPDTVNNVTFNLYANDNLVESQSLTGTDDSLTFSDKPKYDKNHLMYEYTVKEEPIEDFMPFIRKKTMMVING